MVRTVETGVANEINKEATKPEHKTNKPNTRSRGKWAKAGKACLSC